MTKLLLTAFEPFDGEPINPSGEAARAVQNLPIENGMVEVLVLPVARFQCEDIVLEYLRRTKPDIILMLGQASRRFRVTPERVAINVDDFPIPDNTGHQPQNEPIVPGGPVGYFATLPNGAIVAALKTAQIPAALSNSAGTYLCNRLLYRVLHTIAVENLPIRAGFLHLPYLHEQTVDKLIDFPSLSRQTLTDAVRIAVEVCLRETRL